MCKVPVERSHRGSKEIGMRVRYVQYSSATSAIVVQLSFHYNLRPHNLCKFGVVFDVRGQEHSIRTSFFSIHNFNHKSFLNLSLFATGLQCLVFDRGGSGSRRYPRPVTAVARGNGGMLTWRRRSFSSCSLQHHLLDHVQFTSTSRK